VLGGRVGRPRITKRRRWLLRAAAVVLAASSLGCVYRVNREANQVAQLLAQGMLHGHVTRGVEREAWKRVRVGMTKREVEALLGEAPCKRTTTREHVANGQDWWEYGYASSIFAPAPDNRSHVVYFDSDGRVASISEPTS